LYFPVSGKVDNKICHEISVCLRFREKSSEHTQPPLILESIEQSNNPRVSSPKPHESILLGEGGGHFFVLYEVCLLENFDGVLLARADVGCELHLVCGMGLSGSCVMAEQRTVEYAPSPSKAPNLKSSTVAAAFLLRDLERDLALEVRVLEPGDIPSSCAR
jgi:hypothetical protein